MQPTVPTPLDLRVQGVCGFVTAGFMNWSFCESYLKYKNLGWASSFWLNHPIAWTLLRCFRLLCEAIQCDLTAFSLSFAAWSAMRCVSVNGRQGPSGRVWEQEKPVGTPSLGPPSRWDVRRYILWSASEVVPCNRIFELDIKCSAGLPEIKSVGFV